MTCADRPNLTLVRTLPDGSRHWRQDPIDFSGHRTVAEIDAAEAAKLRSEQYWARVEELTGKRRKR